MTPREKARTIIQLEKKLSGKKWEEIAESYNKQYKEEIPYTRQTLTNKIARGKFTMEFAIKLLKIMDKNRVELDLSDITN